MYVIIVCRLFVDKPIDISIFILSRVCSVSKQLLSIYSSLDYPCHHRGRIHLFIVFYSFIMWSYGLKCTYWMISFTDLNEQTLKATSPTSCVAGKNNSGTGSSPGLSITAPPPPPSSRQQSCCGPEICYIYGCGPQIVPTLLLMRCGVAALWWPLPPRTNNTG